jgi:GxxExxY protein
MSLSHGGDLSERVIGLAINVHRQLGPGLLESVYEECLCFELKYAGIPYQRQIPFRIVYKGFASHVPTGWISWWTASSSSK